MATVIIAAYRDGRLAELPLTQLYAAMDQAVAASFPGRFATAQLGQLDTGTGVLSWANAGHPAALWMRQSRVIGELTGPISRPVGFGAGTPVVQTVQLEPGDRVLFFTDGVVEERLPDGEQFGEERLRDLLEQTTTGDLTCAETVRLLSHELMAARSGRTSDDASLLLMEWKCPPRDDELDRDIPECDPGRLMRQFAEPADRFSGRGPAAEGRGAVAVRGDAVVPFTVRSASHTTVTG